MTGSRLYDALLRCSRICFPDFANSAWPSGASSTSKPPSGPFQRRRRRCGGLTRCHSRSRSWRCWLSWSRSLGNGNIFFPRIRTAERPITDNTLNAALRRLGFGKEEVTAHGFRATASMLLNEMGKWHPGAIERQLAHFESNDVRRAYARGAYWDERVTMMRTGPNISSACRPARRF